MSNLRVSSFEQVQDHIRNVRAEQEAQLEGALRAAMDEEFGVGGWTEKTLIDRVTRYVYRATGREQYVLDHSRVLVSVEAPKFRWTEQ